MTNAPCIPVLPSSHLLPTLYPLLIHTLSHLLQLDRTYIPHPHLLPRSIPFHHISTIHLHHASLPVQLYYISIPSIYYTFISRACLTASSYIKSHLHCMSPSPLSNFLILSNIITIPPFLSTSAYDFVTFKYNMS